MDKLYYFPLCPFSRKIRAMLKEKSIDFESELIRPWERRKSFLRLNPANELPVLVEADSNFPIAYHQAIAEYLDEMHKKPLLMGVRPHERAEIRRIAGWFDDKFYNEVTAYILNERLYKYFEGNTPPDSRCIRAAKQNIITHLQYIEYLTRDQKWLAGSTFSVADISAAAQISVVDYFSDVPWDEAPPAVKHWYSLVKSRPSFRPILKETITGFKPPVFYMDPDF